METRRSRSCPIVTFILLYHDVVEPESQDSAGFPGQLAARYKLAPPLFEAHLDAIAATGVRIELVLPDSSPPDAALTFDDAGASALTAAASLEERGWRVVRIWDFEVERNLTGCVARVVAAHQGAPGYP